MNFSIDISIDIDVEVVEDETYEVEIEQDDDFGITMYYEEEFEARTNPMKLFGQQRKVTRAAMAYVFWIHQRRGSAYICDARLEIGRGEPDRRNAKLSCTCALRNYKWNS